MTTLKLSLIATLCAGFMAFADKVKVQTGDTAADSSLMVAINEYMRKDSLINTFKYDTTGEIMLKGNIAKYKIPKGFKYLNPEQSIQLLSEVWGNPKDESILGMILPDSGNPMSTWAFTISYEKMGHVKDDDAEDIDADELLTEMRKDVDEANKLRTSQGYGSVSLIGWAEKPYYDKDKKILYWSKELNFDGDSTNTLNYNVRILGKEGVLVLNAIGGMNQFEQIKPHVKSINEAFAYEKGHRYDEFDPSIDQVAAYGIGGLIAGKVLAKVGIFAFLGKFLKVIILAIGAGIVWIYKFFTGKVKGKDKRELMDLDKK